MKIKFATVLIQLLCISSLIFAQSISYSDEVNMQGLSKENLIYNTHIWLGNDVTVEDLTSNIIESTLNIETYEGMLVIFDAKFELNENEYAYIFDNFTYQDKTGTQNYGLITEESLCFTNPGAAIKIKMLHKLHCKEIKFEIKNKIKDLAENINEGMRIRRLPDEMIVSDSPFSNGIIYSDGIEIANLSKQKAYRKVHAWFAQTYDDVNTVLKRKDEEQGILLGLTGFDYKPPGVLSNESKYGKIEYKIKVTINEGTVNYTIYDFTHPSLGLIGNADECLLGDGFITKKRMEVLCADLKYKINENTELLVNTLKSTLINEEEIKDENDWINVANKGGYMYTEIVEANNLTKNELFDKALEWFSKEYPNNTRMFEIKDKQAGELHATSAMKFKYMMRNDQISYDIIIQLKDNAYKYNFYNFTHQASGFDKDVGFGYIYDNAEDCFKSKTMVVTKKMRLKACTKLNERIELEIDRLVNSLAEILK